MIHDSEVNKLGEANGLAPATNHQRSPETFSFDLRSVYYHACLEDTIGHRLAQCWPSTHSSSCNWPNAQFLASTPISSTSFIRLCSSNLCLETFTPSATSVHQKPPPLLNSGSWTNRPLLGWSQKCKETINQWCCCPRHSWCS